MTAVETTDPARVLIIKPSSLGDVVTAVPLLRALRRKFPGVQVSWLLATACLPLLAEDPDLHEAIEFDRKRLGRCWWSPGAAGALIALLKRLRKGRYDWVIDLQGLFRSGLFARVSGASMRAGFSDARELAPMFYTEAVTPEQPHTVDRNLAVANRLGLDAVPEDMTLHVPVTAATAAAELLGDAHVAGRRYVVCVPPTRWKTKQYPVRHWRKVVSELSQRLMVVLLGAPGERDLCAAVAAGQGDRVVDLSGKTSVIEMAAVISAAAGVVCSDSAAQFIAPAVGTPAVVLIGPTRVEQTGPYRGQGAIVADVPCQGCRLRRCGHITCMQVIEPADVLRAVEQMLEQRNT